MNRMPDNYIDLLVTLPPYNCGIQYGVYNDNLKWDKYLQWCTGWLCEIKWILKPDGKLYLNVLLEMGTENNKKRVSPYTKFYKILNEIGMHIFRNSV